MVSGWVVVTFMASPCEQDPSMRCPMEVIGPFASQDECNAEAARQPGWVTAHRMLLRDPDD